MPTQHQRTNITHTPQVVHALKVARNHWPDERDSALLLHVLDAGTKVLESRAELAAQERRARLRQVAGKYSGVYGPGYLEEVRDGWTE